MTSTSTAKYCVRAIEAPGDKLQVVPPLPSPADIAKRFGLGRPTSELRNVTGGASHRLYRLTTDEGMWAVKVLNYSDEPWWLEAFTKSAELEAAAINAGIAAPRPILPLDVTASVIASFEPDSERPHWVRVHEWVAGSAPKVPAGETISRWVGAIMATLTNLNATTALTSDLVYKTHDLDEWRAWVDEANSKNLECAELLERSLPLIADANAIVEAARVMNRPMQLMHCDVSPSNVLICDDKPLLIDWDAAGPEVPWFDFVGSALRFADFASGNLSVESFRTSVIAYRDNAYSEPDPVDELAFAGLVRSQVRSLAFFLWRALGDRKVSPEEEQASQLQVHVLVDELDIAMSSIGNWARLLA